MVPTAPSSGLVERDHSTTAKLLQRGIELTAQGGFVSWSKAHLGIPIVAIATEIFDTASHLVATFYKAGFVIANDTVWLCTIGKFTLSPTLTIGEVGEHAGRSAGNLIAIIAIPLAAFVSCEVALDLLVRTNVANSQVQEKKQAPTSLWARITSQKGIKAKGAYVVSHKMEIASAIYPLARKAIEKGYHLARNNKKTFGAGLVGLAASHQLLYWSNGHYVMSQKGFDALLHLVGWEVPPVIKEIIEAELEVQNGSRGAPNASNSESDSNTLNAHAPPSNGDTSLVQDSTAQKEEPTTQPIEPQQTAAPSAPGSTSLPTPPPTIKVTGATPPPTDKKEEPPTQSNLNVLHEDIPDDDPNVPLTSRFARGLGIFG